MWSTWIWHFIGKASQITEKKEKKIRKEQKLIPVVCVSIDEASVGVGVSGARVCVAVEVGVTVEFGLGAVGGGVFWEFNLGSEFNFCSQFKLTSQ